MSSATLAPSRPTKNPRQLRARTLTSLYNQRPAWLSNAHAELDAAVASAYGFDPAISDEEILARLLELNHAQA